MGNGQRLKVAQLSGLGTIWGEYSPDVLDVDGPTVGGGESAMLETSFRLAELGHEVTCYYPGQEATYRGVHFQPLQRAITACARGEHSIVVSWSADVLHCLPKGVLRVFAQQLNDLPREPQFWANLDLLVSPSQWHLDYLVKTFGPAGRPVSAAVVPNGVRLERYTDQPPFAARAPIVSYWSSPDRGLHHLLAAWPRVLDAIPEATLNVFYNLVRWVEGVKTKFHYAAHCWRGRAIEQQLKDLRHEHLTVHGPISRNQLARWQMRTKVLAYPCEPMGPTEGFGNALCEGYAAGARVISRPVDALQEVHGPGVEWSEAPVGSIAEDFAARIVAGLRADSNPLSVAGWEHAKTLTWAKAGDALERALLGALEARG